MKWIHPGRLRKTMRWANLRRLLYRLRNRWELTVIATKSERDDQGITHYLCLGVRELYSGFPLFVAAPHSSDILIELSIQVNGRQAAVIVVSSGGHELADVAELWGLR